MTDFQQKKPFSTRPAILLALILGISLGAGLLSTASLKASNSPAPLAFISPIGLPQLSLGKSVDNNAPTPGTQISYTLSYSNNQAGTQAFNVQLYDFLPAGAQLISSNPPAVSNSNGVLLFTTPSIGPGTENHIVTLQVRVLDGHTQLLNHALVAADGVTPTVASLLTNIVHTPSDSLRLVKGGYAIAPIVNPLVYTLEATNVGSTLLSDVTVVDVLPGGLSLGTASPQPDLVTLPMVHWSLGTLAPAESKTIVITTTAPAATGVLTNSAVASAWQNIMTQTLFSTQIVNNGAILHVTKTGSASGVSVGNTLVYKLSYDNIGNQTATTVRLTDTLPANLTVIAVSRPADYQTAQKLSWNLGDLTSSAQGQIVITATIGGPGNRMLHNVVDMTGQPGSYAGHAELDTVVRPFSLYLPIVLKND